MYDSLFPAGTPVCISQTTRLRGGSAIAEVVGVIEAWEESPTGSWHAHGRNGKLWLTRCRIRKADGEVALLVIDDSTEIAKLESANPR